MRFTSVPLTLRSEPLLSKPAPKGREEPSTTPVSANGPPAYVSLLGSEPYSPPESLARSLGLPSRPRFALPEPLHSADAEFVATSDNLKYLAKIVEAFTAQIHDVQLAHRAAVIRMELQRQEYLRQKEKYREAVDSIEKLKRPDAIQQKMKRLQENQKVLLARLDGRLQSMMRKASPELSDQEKKWFEELKRLKEEISGAGRYDEGSFTARVALVRGYRLQLSPNTSDTEPAKTRIRSDSPQPQDSA
jgi:nucleoporin NUP82